MEVSQIFDDTAIFHSWKWKRVHTFSLKSVLKIVIQKCRRHLFFCTWKKGLMVLKGSTQNNVYLGLSPKKGGSHWKKNSTLLTVSYWCQKFVRGLVSNADVVSDVFGQILLVSWCQIPAGAERGGKITKMIKQSCFCTFYGEKTVLTSGLK